jgi:lipopolysaccharide export system protein LptA
MTADDSRRIVTFTGRVVARQGDLVISCDVMRVSYQPVGSYRETPARGGPGTAGAPPVPPRAGAGSPARPAAADGDLGPPPPSPAPETLPQGLPEAVDQAAGMDPAAEGEREGSRRSPLQGGQEIDRVEAEGAVKIQQGERMAVADKALYLAKALPRRLVLTGEARVWQGTNSITGYQITYYLDENRSLVDSQGSRRVRAFYEQGGSGK